MSPSLDLMVSTDWMSGRAVRALPVTFWKHALRCAAVLKNSFLRPKKAAFNAIHVHRALNFDPTDGSRRWFSVQRILFRRWNCARTLTVEWNLFVISARGSVAAATELPAPVVSALDELTAPTTAP